ncbi:hypothetical protein ASPCADRAFT_165669 [Aspergillus carbonarius ITEM 5010]|uniref:Aminoglycoside phosphotransferase domain-containing protein n=1 Tax=Aspergillus carbonarius (strain ITEM 5010) TaxID=602072 RepID=A0A1R3RRP1_ASPC5|nr:hypothetical protein ASPCADRAFT_165669 [Aspergillus carbonarius ITEM 5010]
MDFDHLAEERSNLIFAVWVQNLVRNSPERLAAKLASQHCPGEAVTAARLSNGASNFCYRVSFEDGTRVVVRFTALGRVLLRREKVKDEVAIMEYIAQHTSIPVSKVLGSGQCALGPYIVMTFIEGKPLSGYLTDPSKETSSLRPAISLSTLKRAYFGMANIILELSKPEFPFIGALQKDDDDKWTMYKAPLTFNMNRLTQFSNIPVNVFTKHRFSTAADYFEDLAQHHFHHLSLQRNDAVDDETDYRKKYIARCLFRKLSRQISTEHCAGPFRLYCDDLRPDNSLVDEPRLMVTGVVDWEFTYAAPVEYTYAAPWWLLLERPEDWEEDLNVFLDRYMPRFRQFLEVLRDCEAIKLRQGSLAPEQRLSDVMEKSIESGLFWICLALRHGSMFDEIYWGFIDEKFHGPFGTMEERMGLLNEEERVGLDMFCRKKMEQMREEKLDVKYSVAALVEM